MPAPVFPDPLSSGEMFVFPDKSSQIVTFVREIRHFSGQTDQFKHSIREKSDFHGQIGVSLKEYPPVQDI